MSTKSEIEIVQLAAKVLLLDQTATPGPWTAELDVFDAEEGICATISDPIGAHPGMLIKTQLDPPMLAPEPWSREAADAQWREAKTRPELHDATTIAVYRTAAPELATFVLLVEQVLREAADSYGPIIYTASQDRHHIGWQNAIKSIAARLGLKVTP